MKNELRDSVGNIKTNQVFAAAEYYDWEIERNLPTSFTIYPGDSIQTTCYYD
eukprot:CAMPEP_0204834606 /NCGR_PEP_ID=MMETSP1346-20131115/20170_1 /ASSEMBLY_ACC=CAM_ASM_000771 /TAXON_ID=215587 /ORGANISM="Aplanochytrium stocchinoi, Strain GSBS06" /LENGTH=51 /DNA_ID=CAMNT_0051967999 /DNA_START=89 /DNA_END=241 /DNA_ORIENTATION=+